MLKNKKQIHPFPEGIRPAVTAEYTCVYSCVGVHKPSQTNMQQDEKDVSDGKESLSLSGHLWMTHFLFCVLPSLQKVLR